MSNDQLTRSSEIVRSAFGLDSIFCRMHAVSLSRVERLLCFWSEYSNTTALLRYAIFLSGLLLICGTTAFIGAVPTRLFGHDIFILLDNGWRVVNGQHPHIDYTSAWGPLTFLIVGLGLNISDYSADGVGYGNALFGLLVGLWCYRVSRGRFEEFPRLLLCLFMVTLIVAPYVLGTSSFESSHAMTYNRYGYALLGIIMLEAFQPIEDPRQETEKYLGGISSGVAAGLALFLKASYFFASLPLILASIVFFGWHRSRILGLIFGFSLILFILLAYLRFDIRAMVGDLQMAAGARSQSLSFNEFKRIALNNISYLLIVISLGIAGNMKTEEEKPIAVDIRIVLLGILVFFIDICIRCTNAQWGELPLVAIFALLTVNKAVTYFRKNQLQNRAFALPYSLAVLGLGGSLFLPLFSHDLLGLTYGALSKVHAYSPPVRFTEPRLASLLLYDGADPKSNGRMYTTYVNDGIALLKKVSKPEETILTMDMANPFPYALGRKPPLGGIAAVAYKFTLDDIHRPSDENYFGNTDIVMVPKRHALDDICYDGFYRIYEPALHQRFKLVAESEWWYLFRRTQNLTDMHS